MTAPGDKVPPIPPRPLVREPEDVLGYTVPKHVCERIRYDIR